jgi:hypothetical protein
VREDSGEFERVIEAGRATLKRELGGELPVALPADIAPEPRQ